MNTEQSVLVKIQSGNTNASHKCKTYRELYGLKNFGKTKYSYFTAQKNNITEI